MATHSLVLPLRQPEPERDVLAEFIRGSQPWGAERVPLPTRLRRLLWVLMPTDLVWGTMLAAVALGPGTCGEDRVCQVATLGDRSPILALCAGVSLLGLAMLAIPTQGLARADAKEVTGLTIAAIVGALALTGVFALLVAVLAGLTIVTAFWAVFTYQPDVRRSR